MADENELRELEERIGKLKFHEQLYLFERILTAYRREREEAVAWIRTSGTAYREAEKRLREANEPAPFPPEAKREAG